MSKCSFYGMRHAAVAVAAMVVAAVGAVVLTSCRRASSASGLARDTVVAERRLVADVDAMRRMEGIWVDGETEAVLLKIVGDSIFYPDSTAMPARFIIFDDTLLIYGANDMRYPIRRLGDYVFDYVNLQGETVHLQRSADADDSLLFTHRRYAPILLGQVVKRDTVVFAPSGARYHLYIDVNPTRRRVFASSYTGDGMAVQQVYYDNIIHISVYEGRTKLFARDIDKRMFADLIPAEFLEGAVLSNMEWGRTSNTHTVFQATVCEPEGARCYVVDLKVGYDGSLQTELASY